MERILIEFYSPRSPENLISLLKGTFDEVHFLFFQEEAPTKKAKEQIIRVIKDLLGFEPRFVLVEKKNIETVKQKLSSLWKEGCRLTIDITGGNEIFIAAAGIFLGENEEKPIFLHQYDVPSGKRIFSFPWKKEETDFLPRYLNVVETLSLGNSTPLSAPSHAFGYGPLKSEILRLWEAVKRYPKEWNHFCSLSSDPKGRKSSLFQKCIGSENEKKGNYVLIARALKNHGIMTGEKEVMIRGKLFAEFNLAVPKEALFLYEKAGNLLEMYTALAAYETGLFHDIRVGVTADLNGILAPDQCPDPKNEIDVVMMRENLPILASCKNTYPQNEYLYEILTVSRLYGGFYATPLLFASGSASPTVRERAKEMNVILIDGIRRLSLEELKAKIKETLA